MENFNSQLGASPISSPLLGPQATLQLPSFLLFLAVGGFAGKLIGHKIFKNDKVRFTVTMAGVIAGTVLHKKIYGPISLMK